MVAVQMEIFTHSSAAIQAAELIRLRLSAAPVSGWMASVIQPYLQRRTESVFNTESAPDGNAWAELAPETIQRRMDDGYPAGPIQYRSGELFNWFQQAGADFTFTQIGTAMIWPSKSTPTGKLPYKIGSAQMGNRRTGAPARPIIGLTLQDLEFATLGLFEYIVGVRL